MSLRLDSTNKLDPIGALAIGDLGAESYGPAMDLDDLLQCYFATSNLSQLNPDVLATGIEKCQVDLGLEQDPGKRFALRALVHHNVARDVKLRRSERHDPDRVFPTKDEIKALIANAPPKHQPIIMTALLTGMRMSELRGLTWDAIDFGRSIITVRKRADRYCDMGNTKSKSGRREIPMGPGLANVLKAWRVACPKGDLDLVFPNGVGNVETHSNIYNRIFKPLMLKSGIVDGEGAPRFSLHAMRHAAASLFIEQGWPPKKIQTMLGHSSITMTYDVYGHLFHDPAKDVDLMGEMERGLLAA